MMIEKAKYELNLLLEKCEDEEERQMQKLINDNALEIIKKFSEMGHSGFTAEYEINMIVKLLRQQNLTKLTLNDDEFEEISKGLFQNKRDSRIFKSKNNFNGKPYNIETMKEYDADKGE